MLILLCSFLSSRSGIGPATGCHGIPVPEYNEVHASWNGQCTEVRTFPVRFIPELCLSHSGTTFVRYCILCVSNSQDPN